VQVTTNRQADEYRALRATIAQRGTVRLILAPLTIAVWAAVAVTTAAAITIAMSSLVPLLVLAAGFEAVFALHLNVERIGRYIQVFHEPDGGWEHVAMEFGRRFGGGGPDALFSRLFMIAAVLNFLPSTLVGTPVDIAVLAVLHVAFIVRVRIALTVAAGQRARDLERFAVLRQSMTAAGDARQPAE
jgi:fatty acid desaturase